MEYNIDKCQSITFEEKLALSDPLFLNGKIVPTVDSIKDLGITISNNITWDNHIQKKLVAARKAYHFLKRSIPHSVSSSTKLMYYRLCVQSIILYGSQIWYPPLITDGSWNYSIKNVFFLGNWFTKLFTAAGSVKYSTPIILFGPK